MRSYLVLAATFLCVFPACQKEPDELLTSPNCKVEQIFYYNPDGTIGDTINIEYNGDQVSKVDYGTFYAVPEFTNGLVTKKTYYLDPANIAFIEQLSYNADSTLHKVDVYSTPTGDVEYSYLFTWAGHQLIKREHYEDTAGTGQVLITQDIFTYSGNNISRDIYRDLKNQFSDTTNFFYDNQLNYFQKTPVLLLADGLFLDYLGIGMAFALSENNVVSFDQNSPATKADLAYDENEKQEMESMKLDGKIYSRYKYKCQ